MEGKYNTRRAWWSSNLDTTPSAVSSMYKERSALDQRRVVVPHRAAPSAFDFGQMRTLASSFKPVSVEIVLRIGGLWDEQDLL